MLNTEDRFREIYDNNKNLILKLAYDMTKDYHLAQDICQETFIRLYGFQGEIIEERVRGWLLVVASHLVYDYRKKASSQREVLADEMEEERSTSPINIYLDRIEQNRLCSEVLHALREKNEDWYEVLILVEYLGVPRKTVAKKRGVSLSTIDNYLRKGKNWMKKNFQEEYENL